MRINLTKKDLINSIYMQVGFSKQIAENLIDEFFSIIILNLTKNKDVKISKFGTFSFKSKKSRIGRNPKTGIEVPIKERNVVTFSTSNVLKSHFN